jgi:hypothetical protein
VLARRSLGGACFSMARPMFTTLSAMQFAAANGYSRKAGRIEATSIKSLPVRMTSCQHGEARQNEECHHETRFCRAFSGRLHLRTDNELCTRRRLWSRCRSWPWI